MKKLLIYFLIAFTCALITIGLIHENTIALAALFILFCVITADTIMLFTCALFDYIKSKLKKKTKTSRIRIKVGFVSKHDVDNAITYQIFWHSDFTNCIKNAFRYAEIYKYKIKSIELLTTEE